MNSHSMFSLTLTKHGRKTHMLFLLLKMIGMFLIMKQNSLLAEMRVFYSCGYDNSSNLDRIVNYCIGTIEASTEVLIEFPNLQSSVLPDELLLTTVFYSNEAKHGIMNYKLVFQNISPHLKNPTQTQTNYDNSSYSNHVML